MQAGINIYPSCKVREGRENRFFRSAMEPFVPFSTAWRKKIGIHQGGGLQSGLDALFEVLFLAITRLLQVCLSSNMPNTN
jgi:hypothetical protein